MYNIKNIIKIVLDVKNQKNVIHHHEKKQSLNTDQEITQTSKLAKFLKYDQRFKGKAGCK